MSRNIDRCYDHAKLCEMCGEQPSENGVCPSCQSAPEMSAEEFLGPER